METESRSENPSMFKFWFCNRSEFSEFIVHKLKGSSIVLIELLLCKYECFN